MSRNTTTAATASTPAADTAEVRTATGGRTPVPTAGQIALSFAGISVELAARKAGVSVDYLRRVLKNGAASYVLAKRLGRICQCGFDVFMFSYSVKSQQTGGANGKRQNRKATAEKQGKEGQGRTIRPCSEIKQKGI